MSALLTGSAHQSGGTERASPACHRFLTSSGQGAAGEPTSVLAPQDGVHRLREPRLRGAPAASRPPPLLSPGPAQPARSPRAAARQPPGAVSAPRARVYPRDASPPTGSAPPRPSGARPAERAGPEWAEPEWADPAVGGRGLLCAGAPSGQPRGAAGCCHLRGLCAGPGAAGVRYAGRGVRVPAPGRLSTRKLRPSFKARSLSLSSSIGPSLSLLLSTCPLDTLHPPFLLSVVGVLPLRCWCRTGRGPGTRVRSPA